MKRGLVLVLLGACGPKADYTPQIAVQPYAEQRICYVCVGAVDAAERCAPEVEEACARLRSDVVRAPVVNLEESPDE